MEMGREGEGKVGRYLGEVSRGVRHAEVDARSIAYRLKG